MVRRIALILVLAAAVAAGSAASDPGRDPGRRRVRRRRGTRAGSGHRPPGGRVRPLARDRLRPSFRRRRAVPAGAITPARSQTEHELQLYAAGVGQPLRYIQSFRIVGASGGLGRSARGRPSGPRRDLSHRLPQSAQHRPLVARAHHPNDFDLARAAEDGRDSSTLGGEIMIHGGGKSVGCLAIGDLAAEDLFVLAADSDWHSAVVVISPVDFRRATLPVGYRAPVPWVDQLYTQLRTQMFSLPARAGCRRPPSPPARIERRPPVTPVRGRRTSGAASSRRPRRTPPSPSAVRRRLRGL